MLTAAALGSLIGVVLALTGAGGGILAIPLLVFALQLPVQQAAPIGLAAVGIASALGAAMGLKLRIVRYRAAMLIGFSGMLVAPIGVALAQHLPDKPLLVLFALIMCWVAWKTWRGAASTPAASSTQDQACKVSSAGGRLTWTSRCARAMAGTGALSGLLSGLLGVGGGFVIVPALTHHTDLDIRSIQATSLAVIALVSVSGVGSAIWHGSMNAGIALPFAAGASIALLLTQRIAQLMQAALLKGAFALLCLLAAGLMLLKAAGPL